MRRAGFILVALALGALIGRGKAAPADAVVTVVAPAPVTIAPGETLAVALQVAIADGYHVQANPAGNEFLIPLELSVDAVRDVVVSEIVYPEPVPFRLEGTTEDLPTYANTVVIRLTLTVPGAAKPGKQMVTGRLRYQACDARRCLFPATAPVAIAVIVPAG